MGIALPASEPSRPSRQRSQRACLEYRERPDARPFARLSTAAGAAVAITVAWLAKRAARIRDNPFRSRLVEAAFAQVAASGAGADRETAKQSDERPRPLRDRKQLNRDAVAETVLAGTSRPRARRWSVQPFPARDLSAPLAQHTLRPVCRQKAATDRLAGTMPRTIGVDCRKFVLVADPGSLTPAPDTNGSPLRCRSADCDSRLRHRPAGFRRKQRRRNSLCPRLIEGYSEATDLALQGLIRRPLRTLPVAVRSADVQPRQRLALLPEAPRDPCFEGTA